MKTDRMEEKNGGVNEGDGFEGFTEDEINERRKILMEQIAKIDAELHSRNARHSDAMPAVRLGEGHLNSSETIQGQLPGQYYELKTMLTSLTNEIHDMKRERELEKTSFEQRLNHNEEENRALRREIEALRESLGSVGGQGGEERREEENDWNERIREVKDQVEQKVTEKFTDIMEQQKKEQIEEIRRETDRDRTVMIFGVPETSQPDVHEREELEKRRVKRIMDALSDSEDEKEATNREIDMIYRVGKYSRGTQRPMRVQFKSKSMAGKVLKCAGRLNRTADLREVRIKQDLNRHKREKLRELIIRARHQNSQLTVEEQSHFFYWADPKIMDIVKRKCGREGRQEMERRQDMNQQ